MKPARILRADRLEQSMNIGKERRVAQFIRDYRSVARSAPGSGGCSLKPARSTRTCPPLTSTTFAVWLCEENRAAYTPDIDNIGVDFGRATLLTTSEGDLYGRGLLADLVRIDRQNTGIARHRQRAGGKPRDSERYRRLVTRLRGMLKTRINRALNSIVEDRKPAELTVEHLNARPSCRSA
jgi:hypothetical protein